MLKVEKIQDYLWIHGGDSDWYFLPKDPSFSGYGVQGEWFWLRDRSGELAVYHVPSRRKIGSVTVRANSGGLSTFHLPSRDGSRLFILESSGKEPGLLQVVNLTDATCTRRIEGLHGHVSPPPVERSDGRLVLVSFLRVESSLTTTITVVDPNSGIRSEESIQEAPYSVSFNNIGFRSLSPDGRHLLRIDHTSLPQRSSKVGGIFGFGAKDGPPHFGVTVQIWQTAPLLFLRRTVVAWLKTEELPDEAHLSVAKNSEKTGLNRAAVWQAISGTASKREAGPYESGPPREAYPASISGNDEAWSAIQKNHQRLSKDWVKFEDWQPDGEAFWVTTNSFLTCVGIDGSTSPRLYLQRLGLRKGTWLPCAAYITEVKPLPDRQAQAFYPEGLATFDGKATPETLSPVALPEKEDRWVDKTRIPEIQVREAARKKVQAMAKERQILSIPLAEWSEKGVIDALKLLRKEMGPALYRQSVDHMIDLRFDLAGKPISEPEFFIALRERFPSAAPALRDLIDGYVAAAQDQPFLFSVGEDGAGLFANAVKSLAVLDVQSIPTLLGYGKLVDAGHEYFFAGDTVPAFIKAQGWTDPVLDFVFWILIRNYYNTLQDYGAVWKEWGMRDACLQRDPITLARHLAALYAADLAEDSYGVEGLVQLACEVSQPHEPWEAAFFTELGNLLQTDMSGKEAI